MNRACPPCHHDCGQGNARHCPARDPLAPRYSRSLREAFPGTSTEISEPEDADYPPAWWFCVIAIAAFTAYVIWVTR